MARIAVGGFQHESNSFSTQPADWMAFATADGWPGLCRGVAVFDAMAGRNLPLAGFIARAARLGHMLLPLSWCAAQPSGPVTDQAFERVMALLLSDLAEQMPVDAVYLDLHGAMIVASYEDGEAEIVRRVRALVGPATAIAVSLDLHANIGQGLIDRADIVTVYRTYPHIDFAETGGRAADLLHTHLKGRPFRGKVRLPAPFLVPLTAQCTLEEPAQSLYAAIPGIEAETGAALSLAMGFPPADIPDCGPAVIAYGPESLSAAKAADRLFEALLAAEGAFHQHILSPDAAVAEARRLAAGARRPVIIADTQDNPGAGGASDSPALLAALVRAGAENALLGLICDPEAADIAHRAGLGEVIDLALGGRTNRGEEPYRGRFTVLALHDGPFDGTGPVLSGALDIGRMALLGHAGVRVAVSSRRLQPMSRAVFTILGADPAQAAIIVVKSTVHFRGDFQGIAEAILIAGGPGCNPADPSTIPYRRLRPGVRLKLRAG